eukprot:NODE_378_length_9766_cov_0.333816.p2 type:complete len:871 gc:universal NODE_378_length_9766_cov_0.333816:3128-5740(+)
MDVLKQLQLQETNHIMSLRNFEGKIAMQSFYEGLVHGNLISSIDVVRKDVYNDIMPYLKHFDYNDELFPTISKLLHTGAEYLALSSSTSFNFAKFLIWIPVKSFEPKLVMLGVSLWSWVIYKNKTLEDRFLSEVIKAFQWTAKHHHGIFNIPLLKTKDPFKSKISYNNESSLGIPKLDSHKLTSCHAMMLKFLIDRVNSGSSYLFSKNIIDLFTTISASKIATHASVRPCFLLFVVLGFRWIKSYRVNDHLSITLTEKLFDVIFQWFSHPTESYDGENQFYPLDELKVMLDLYELVDSTNLPNNPMVKQLFLLFLDNEIDIVMLHLHPLQCKLEKQTSPASAISISNNEYVQLTTLAYSINPRLAYRMIRRFIKVPIIQDTFNYLEKNNPNTAMNDCSDVIDTVITINTNPAHPLRAITLLISQDSIVLQYAVRSLQQYPISDVFFFIPQLVQALRYDTLGYVELFILRAAKSNSKFSHLIIWNLKANLYSDVELLIPDIMKYQFERLISKIELLFTGEMLLYYNREFEFFNKITNISKVLKPFVKQSKEFKKKKIDDELSHIKVDVGVYLPSSPETTVIDIDYNSGRPLQSHAKTPFMATFMTITNKIQSPVSAIFKVGDDCRQDVLALQIIAICKNIFESQGLNTYLFPYRVVASDTGCGVIEVIPNSSSRDMIGREKINSLTEYFVSKFGNMHTIEYQKAKRCFWESMAAYSVVLYILQIKDRHNGNIMIDQHGHIVHIDFGFILDIAPGGIKFEGADFKLTSEMVQLMDNQDGLAYKRFKELTIRAFLAMRPYADDIVDTVRLMADSGLPCFKSRNTIEKLRQRFKTELSEREAAIYMMEVIDKSFENYRTVIYDSFQKQTNGIPY